jgi:eukaryotic-like serine/threonine-protein kinase
MLPTFTAAMEAPRRGGAVAPGGERATRRLDGYRIGRLLGRGRTAAVHLAQDDAGSLVALKLLQRRTGVAEPDWDRFATECALGASVRHPQVVHVHQHRFLGDIAYLSMEYLPGGTLREGMGGGVQPAQAVHLLRHAAAGLAGAHLAGVVHRDVKPENFLWRADGTLVLTDFGSAARVGDAGARVPAGRLLGTLRYAAPEQLQGGAPAATADVYSLGVLFHEMLCGEPPFCGRTPLELVAQHLVAAVPRLPSALACYQCLIDRLLDKQVQRRPPDAAALLHEIHALPRPGGERAA